MEKILINLAERRLYFYKNDTLVKSYPVAIGKPETPTPVGTFTIVNKIVNPANKFLGTRWMGLSIPRYGIHGTPLTWTIGTMASHGCVRMYNWDVEELFPQVPIGTTVEIISGKTKKESEKDKDWPKKPAGGRYIVKKGDSLWKIARRYGVSLEKLIQANNIKNPDMIYPGQEIVIPF